MKHFRTVHSIPIYFVSLFLITTLLAACGGGDSPGDSSSERKYDFDTYTGNQNATQLSADNPAYFIDLLFSNIFQEQSNSASKNPSNNTPASTQPIGVIQVSEFEICDNNGRIEYSGSLSDRGTGIIDLDYQNCEIGGVNYDGTGALEIHSVDSNTGLIQDSITVFEKVLVTDSVSSFRLSGKVRYIPSLSCNPEIITANLVMIDNLGSNQYKTSDLTISTTQHCGDLDGEVISGRIYQSTHGYVDITTITPFRYSNATVLYPDRSGVMLLTGANGSKARLSVNELVVYKLSTINAKEYVNSFDIDVDGDGSYELQSTMTTDSFAQGGWKDIADFDTDGMPNSWESIYGLDQTDPTDASLDSDGDGYSNLTEYIGYGIPTDSTSSPIATDLSLNISVPTTEVRAGREMTIGLVVTNPNLTYGAENIIITLTKPSNAYWTNISSCRVSITNSDQIECPIDSIGQNHARAIIIGFTSDNPGTITLNSSVSSFTFDPNATNNSDSATVTFAQRKSDIGLNTGTQYTYHDVAVVSKSHTFDLFVTQWGPDDARDTVFTMSIPTNINIESAEYVVYPGFDPFIGSSGTCDVNIEVICNIGTLQHNAASYKGEIKITMTGLTEGISAYSASITSVSNDDQPNDNTIEQRLFVGTSLQSFQEQADIATGPTTITIPAGYYVGGINYQDKPLRIESTTGADQTFIWSDSPFSVIDNIYPYFNMGDDGSLSGFTFLGKFRAARLSGTGTIVENNVFEFKGSESYEHNGAQIKIIEVDNAQTTIRNNIFKNYNNTLLCNILRFNGTVSFKIENNLFHDNVTCSTIYVNDYLVSETDIVSQIITNNTFINTSNAINLMMQNENSVVKIQNNIFMSNKNVLSASLPTVTGVTTIIPPVINNNILFNNVNDIRYFGPLNNVPYTGPLGEIPLGSNISADPLFVDEINDNYRLKSTSPGIDAGETIDAPSTDLDGIARPQDGDLNGIWDIDIGTYEYISQ